METQAYMQLRTGDLEHYKSEMRKEEERRNDKTSTKKADTDLQAMSLYIGEYIGKWGLENPHEKLRYANGGETTKCSVVIMLIIKNNRRLIVNR